MERRSAVWVAGFTAFWFGATLFSQLFCTHPKHSAAVDVTPAEVGKIEHCRGCGAWRFVSDDRKTVLSCWRFDNGEMGRVQDELKQKSHPNLPAGVALSGRNQCSPDQELLTEERP